VSRSLTNSHTVHSTVNEKVALSAKRNHLRYRTPCLNIVYYRSESATIAILSVYVIFAIATVALLIDEERHAHAAGSAKHRSSAAFGHEAPFWRQITQSFAHTVKWCIGAVTMCTGARGDLQIRGDFCMMMCGRNRASRQRYVGWKNRLNVARLHCVERHTKKVYGTLYHHIKQWPL